jgi:hypothetical protein
MARSTFGPLAVARSGARLNLVIARVNSGLEFSVHQTMKSACDLALETDFLLSILCCSGIIRIVSRIDHLGAAGFGAILVCALWHSNEGARETGSAGASGRFVRMIPVRFLYASCTVLYGLCAIIISDGIARGFCG